jgi:hypothetical protein
MATKDWKIAYKTTDPENSHIYVNEKKSLWIQRAGKQLGSFDNFTEEKFLVLVQSNYGHDVEKKWFNTKKEANSYFRYYMRNN